MFIYIGDVYIYNDVFPGDCAFGFCRNHRSQTELVAQEFNPCTIYRDPFACREWVGFTVSNLYSFSMETRMS